jgi:hypothetical protein
MHGVGVIEEKKQMAEDVHTTIKIWKSCCLELDADMVQFGVQTLVCLLVLTFSAYQLHRLSACEAIQPYLSMITFILGVFSKNIIKR